MKVLAIDTAGEACSAALSVDGVVSDRYEHAPRRHADLILHMVDAVLAEGGLRLEDLDGIAFGRGPGSFTGVRIAAGVAQGLALAADLPVVGVSDLEAVAHELAAELADGAGPDDVTGVVVAQDARMGEVYAGAWRLETAGRLVPEFEECVSAPGSVPALHAGTWLAAGTGFGVHAETLEAALCADGASLRIHDAGRLARAATIVSLAAERLAAGEGRDAAEALPVYLRDEVAWRK